ncbi:MAG: glutamate-1-semialdehyde-2,1-aminomutase [Elusimicrobia bacterium HGW-Elusimicrobia-1]|jgi:glutamate-1-semialdehyde 2,1-aminomutase|nr:MAG: glutamate-1-semialdehyde-2,1-aminomutase [Elusimicrobia bacterium HGW-Elusimicrobia-1]
MRNSTARRIVAKSKSAFRDALKYIPGGVNSPVRAFTSVGGNPLFVKKARGAELTDVDGNAYTDYCMSWGVHILGHNAANVNRAVRRDLENGSSYGAPTTLETELAKLITGAVPSIEKIRFVNSGTEAAMSAIRLARAFTKRNIILKFDGCYHGHADHLLVSGGSGLSDLPRSSSAGVPRDFVGLTLSVPFNSCRAVRDAFARNKGKIAAVIVEPVPANMGVVTPRDGFLEFLRRMTRSDGTLLIFDEVITGFRLGPAGAQGYYGITPDITCLGKIIGGGLPVGAFGAAGDIMEMLAPSGPVYQAGTLSGNPLAMSAGIAVLRSILKNDFYKTLNTSAGDFARELKAIARKNYLSFNSAGSMFSLFFSRDEVYDYAGLKKCDLKLFAAFHKNMLDEGIYLSPAQGEANFISAVHAPAILERTLRAFSRALSC